MFVSFLTKGSLYALTTSYSTVNDSPPRDSSSYYSSLRLPLGMHGWYYTHTISGISIRCAFEEEHNLGSVWYLADIYRIYRYDTETDTYVSAEVPTLTISEAPL